MACFISFLLVSLELGDLGGGLVVDEPLGVLVHLLAVLLDELGALLTGLDGLADGMLHLVLVGLLHGSELLATTLGLGGLLIDNTSQVLDLGIGLLVVLGDHVTEVLDLLLELGLGLADGIHGIELHAASGSGHLGVLLGLGLLVLLHLGPHGGGTSLE